MPDEKEFRNPEGGPVERFLSQVQDPNPDPPANPFPTEPERAAEVTQFAETDEDEDPEGMPEGVSNVRLSKKRQHEALPKGLLNIGMHSGILIPTKKTQLAGFYVEDPTVLINQFPQYKWVERKDGTRPVQ